MRHDDGEIVVPAQCDPGAISAPCDLVFVAVTVRWSGIAVMA
ncbi:2-dehydropantoate 2-reductase [Cronobacter muytjensii 530]